MMNIYSEDIEVLKELYIHNKLELYFFHEKYKLSPAQLVRTLDKFIALECIKITSGSVELTEKGYKWIFINRKRLFLQKKNKFWRNTNEDITQEQISIGDIYRIKKNRLDEGIFDNIEDRD